MAFDLIQNKLPPKFTKVFFMLDANPDAIGARFAGDSCDGVQLISAQFSQASDLNQNSLSDFSAEIRAPAVSSGIKLAALGPDFWKVS